MGLSLNEDWAHRLHVNRALMRAWCAWDTLFIPLLLDQEATVESASPLSKEVVRVTVSPDGIKQVNPSGAVVSVVVLDPDNGQVKSVQEAWSQFCHQVYFFASREEAERWAEGKDDIEILTVDEAFELGRYAWSEVLSYA
jgi:alkylmercury lyase